MDKNLNLTYNRSLRVPLLSIYQKRKAVLVNSNLDILVRVYNHNVTDENIKISNRQIKSETKIKRD